MGSNIPCSDIASAINEKQSERFLCLETRASEDPQTREAVGKRVLLHCYNSPHPTYKRYLLGFMVHKDIVCSLCKGIALNPKA